MDNLTLEMLKKQSEMGEDIKGIKVSIEYHVKRCDLLEESVQLLRSDIKPIQRHVYFIDAGLRIFGAVGSIVLFIAGCIKIISFFR